MGSLFTKPKPSTEKDLQMAAQLVDTQVAKHPIMVFSKSYCPYCKMAKQALDAEGIPYEVLEIENDPQMSAIQDYLAQKTGGRSVPRVFINGRCIGGGTETAAMRKNGELKRLAKELGVI